MIEVYLNPENENIWEETEEKVDVSENVKTAEKLLKVFSGRSPFCDIFFGSFDGFERRSLVYSLFLALSAAYDCPNTSRLTANFSNIKASVCRTLQEVTDKNKKALLEAYCLIASKKKENMEKALTKFYEIMTNDRSAPPASNSPGAVEKVNVPCLVGMPPPSGLPACLSAKGCARHQHFNK